MNNPNTISHRVQSDIAIAILAKLTQTKKERAEELGKQLKTLPPEVRDYLEERVMQYNINTDLAKLTRPRPEKRFKVYSAADAWKPQPPIEWVVEGLFAKGTVSMIVGNPGSKKTYSMVDMAACIAMGKGWLGLSTNQSPVLLIDEESGVRRINQRLGDVMRGHGAEKDIPLHYISLARFNFRSENGDVTGSQDLVMLEEKIAEVGANLVIIDALADVMPGADENSVKDVQPIFIGLRQVADSTQSAIVVIHHSNRNGDYRGSSAILGALDVMITVQSKPDSPNVDFEVKKHRDGQPNNFAAVANFGTNQFSLTSSQFVRQKKLGKPLAYVLRYLMANGNSTMEAITSNADTCSDRSAKNAVYELVPMGLVYRTDGGGSGKKATFGLTEEGKEKLASMM